MGNAQLALDLLMCDDFAEACHLSAELENVNTQRRTIEAELAEVASEQAERVFKGQRALVVAGEGWHEGVKGIVASRLTNRYGVPSILFTIEGDEAHGSGRSVGDVNLFEAVSSCQDILTRFGGHHAAVGVTLPASKLSEFSERLCAYMDKLPPEDFIPALKWTPAWIFPSLRWKTSQSSICSPRLGRKTPALIFWRMAWLFPG